MGRTLADMVMDDSPEAVAERLERLRAVLDYPTQTAFAQFLGFNSASRYNNILRGLPLSRMAADQIARKVPGVSPDWLRYGDPSGLSVDMERKLRPIGTTSQSPRKGRPGAK